MAMHMTPDLLADQLGELIAGRFLQPVTEPILAIEYARPSMRFSPGRVYAVKSGMPVPPAGSVVITDLPASDFPGSTVLAAAVDVDLAYQAALDVMDRFLRFEKALHEEIDLQSFIDTAAAYLNNQLLVIDRSMAVLAFSSLQPRNADEIWSYITTRRRLPDTVIEQLAPLYRHSKISSSALRERLQKGGELYGVPNVHVDLTDQGAYLGWLVLVGNVSPLTPGFLDVMAQLAEPAVRLMKMQHAETKPDLAFNDYYWQEWLFGRLDNRSLQLAMLRERGWQENDCFQVIRVTLADPSQQRRLSDAIPLSLVLPDETAVTVIARSGPGQPCDKIIDTISQLGANLDMRAGISDVSRHVSRLPALFAQACAARSASGANGGTVCRYADIALLALLDNPGDAKNRRQFMHPAVDQMLQPGSGRYRKYLQTLLSYLENERQLSPTARQLFIHKNTLLYRIGMLTQELGLDLENPDERLRLLLSLKLIMPGGTEKL